MNKKAMQDFGVIYVAFGLPYVYMTYLSIRSLLHFNPNIEILVVTNVAGIEKIMNFDGRVKVKYVKDKTERMRTSLISAIYLSKCKVLSLEERWNCSDVERLYRSNTIRDSIIVHYTSRLTPTIKKELLSIEKIFIEKKSSFEKELSIYFEKEKKHRMNKQGKIIYYEELVNVYFYEIRVLIKKISTTLSSLIRK
jgi:hypothetical protein